MWPKIIITAFILLRIIVGFLLIVLNAKFTFKDFSEYSAPTVLLLIGVDAAIIAIIWLLL
jgi:hypothetical protein